jgi:tetratricopeptide (TPR) repeat protein
MPVTPRLNRHAIVDPQDRVERFVRTVRAVTSQAAAFSLSGLLVFGPQTAFAQDDDFSFDIVEEAVKDTDKVRVEEAKDLLADERYEDALGVLDGILSDKSLSRFHQSTEYDIAKTFYRMGAYHMALLRFQKILEAGPKHEYFGQARNWLFFISRKTKDELAALQLVSTYTKAEDMPADQQAELSYALGRFYFLMALNQGAKGVEVEQSSDEPEPEAPPPEPAADPEPAATDDGDDGFNFSADDLGGGDDDGFGFDFSGAETSTKKKPKKAPKKPKKPKETATKTSAEAAPETKAPPPPPRATKAKSHKNENPQSAEESLAAALKAVDRVDDGYALYAQARYLKGLVHFARGEFEPAVKAFREVVRMTNPRASKEGSEAAVENAKLREMAFFSLARIHYQFEQFRYAIFYYDRISRDSETWLEAVFESSWAHFRLGEYEKSLGNLVTLQSPFFAGEYYPESSILKAITFYENCRYPEARAFLAEFNQNYGGVLKELDRLVGVSSDGAGDGAGAVDGDGAGEAATGAEKVEVKSAEALFEELTALERKVTDGKDDAASSIALTARLLRLALSDKRVAGFKGAIAEIDEEKARLAAMPAPFAGSAMATELGEGLDVRRKELVNQAGTLLRDKLEAERQFLAELKSKLFRIQFQIIKREKETLEATLSNQSQTVSLDGYNFTTATDDERLFWPFEGEYWRDELGTYQYTLTKGCRPPSETTVTGD